MPARQQQQQRRRPQRCHSKYTMIICNYRVNSSLGIPAHSQKHLLPIVAATAAAAAAGEVCLFTQIEWLREQLQQWQEAAAEQQQLAEALQASLAVAGSSSSSEAGDDSADFDDLDDSLHDLPECSQRVSVITVKTCNCNTQLCC
jgi:hypothetical protein